MRRDGLPPRYSPHDDWLYRGGCMAWLFLWFAVLLYVQELFSRRQSK